ncbi:MAG: glycosyltransferase family 2 protein [Myxococcales bacterium]|nr:glycosyltransferase family 2 protein [Myxococcales bacterium]
MKTTSTPPVRIGAALIVRDAAGLLPRCLDSLQGVVDEIVCVDTGSVDETPAIAAGYGAHVLHSPWRDDFSFHRNESLEASTCDWVVVIDGDEWLSNPAELRPAVDAAAGQGLDALLVRVDAFTDGPPSQPDGCPGERFWSARVFRRAGAYYEYPVHNQLRGIQRVGMSPLALRSDYSGTVERKLARSIPMLHRMLEAGTDDAHAHFYLAKSYFAAGRLDAALKHAHAAEPLVGDAAQFAPLWVWMFYATLAVEGLDRAHAALQRGLARHPDFPELHHTAIACAMLQWNASFGRAARYVATPQTTASFVGQLPEAMGALGVPLALEGVGAAGPTPAPARASGLQAEAERASAGLSPSRGLRLSSLVGDAR